MRAGGGTLTMTIHLLSASSFHSSIIQGNRKLIESSVVEQKEWENLNHSNAPTLGIMNRQLSFFK